MSDAVAFAERLTNDISAGKYGPVVEIEAAFRLSSGQVMLLKRTFNFGTSETLTEAERA